MNHVVRNSVLGLAEVLLCLLPTAAQIQMGDLSTNLNGVISAGYNASYGNQIDSSHSIDAAGSGSLSGYYYDPNFVTFNFSPYYGQSRANSTFQSISSASGFNFSSNIFGGSHFPGSVSYAQAYNSEGQFAVPGLPNFTTHGNSDTFGISWSELLPNWPTLTAIFQTGSNQYNIYGVTGNGNADFRAFTLNSAYTLAGFHLGASYQTGVSNSFVPQFLSGQESETINTDNSGYGFNVSHRLPWQGQFFTNFYHSDINTDYAGYTYNGNFDTTVASASIHPIDKLYLSMTADYTDNLAGILYQSLLSSGGIVLPSSDLNSSHAWDMLGAATYALAQNLAAQGQVERRVQSFLGETYGANSYSGGLTYGRTLFGGNLNSTFNIIDTTIDNSNQNALGFSTGVNYGRHIGAWVVGGGFNYAQNVSTLLITYTTSYYNYSANVRRRWGRFNWSAGAGFTHSGLTNQPDTSSSTETYTTSLGYGRLIVLSGNYGKSNGLGLVTGAGLLPVPLPPIIPSSLLTMYGGTSYGASVGSSPIRKLTISASYSKALSNTLSAGLGSSNNVESTLTQFQYQFRKVYLNGGYANLKQGFSASTLPPANISSFYIGISRWFNFF